MEYQRFDPTDCGFPRPKVPVLPALSWQSLEMGHSGLFSQIGSGTNVSHFSRGRYALAEAYRLSGVSAVGALLAPAYHCRTMLDPAIRLGAKIGLYALKPDLSPDLESLAACLAASQQPVKAMLVTHYFGFPQRLEALADFCALNDIALIEDCTHALFPKSETKTVEQNESMGKTGHFVIASPYKFYSCEDGGILWVNGGASLPNGRQRSPGVLKECKGIFHAAQRARNARQVPDVMTLDQEIAASGGKNLLTGQDVRTQDMRPSSAYSENEEGFKSLAGSRFVMRHTNMTRLVDRRRENYFEWAKTVANLPYCQALFPYLPKNCVPYMFPLYIEHPEMHFYSLKRLGVPLWRWDEMAVSECSVASSYRLRVLHLPCHQELTADQMAWMTTAVKKVMLQLPVGAP